MSWRMTELLLIDRHLVAVLRFVAHTAKRSLAFPDQERRKRSAARITHLHS